MLSDNKDYIDAVTGSKRVYRGLTICYLLLGGLASLFLVAAGVCFGDKSMTLAICWLTIGGCLEIRLVLEAARLAREWQEDYVHNLREHANKMSLYK